MRRTKIVCTIGPSCEQEDILKEMIISGMNVARLNFSHGTHEEHRKRIQAVRRAAQELGEYVAILVDTKGPEIRIGNIKGGSAVLKEGQELVLTVEKTEGDSRKISVNYRGLPQDVKEGDTILLDDGLIGLEVREVREKEIVCLVINGGEISSRKGVNVPGVEVRLPSITEKDIADIHFAIEEKVDFIAASFVRRAQDILEIRRILEEHNADISIIAKIENRAGVNNFEEILRVADGIMVARGDLGVEIPSEEVPLLQKQIIEKCNKEGKAVITATQMLESMIRNPRPTRAEASDVANAILDGTDAIMLSGETAVGKYPVETVRTMSRIALRAEEAIHYQEILGKRQIVPQKTVTDAISHATCDIALDLEAAAIITPTASGSTARMVSKYRPKAPIIATSPNEQVLRKLCLVWGVYPLKVSEITDTDQMISSAVAAALEKGIIRSGDLVVITAGVPAGVPGTTNLLKVHIVGEVIAKGIGIGNQVAVGRVRLVKNAAEALRKVQEGDILVTYSTDRDFVPAMERAAAVITGEGGLTSHAAIVGISLQIPVVVGIEDIMEKLEDGSIITVDAPRGLIYRGVTKVL
ncbi:pyruvate kinase [Calderihabitans maritimus]|uniref:Pyruvate kinase n=1 Tax=Calderihabitans maritimus TaxID=1246530 RepID=A0A1Z5HPA9_9FIRM|nr:pyruvate kinase [Calderihabitans maritimus]GAW91161.1 pyruvate kinase Pyk [Calderihabitans maritimus]